MFHNVLLTNEGMVYVWGDNTYGELGLTNQVKMQPNPTILTDQRFGKIIDIAAGARHTLILT